MKPRIVMDTNVFVAALRSRRGASFHMLSLIGSERFAICVSVPLVLEYEAVAKRPGKTAGVPSDSIDDILDYMCQVAERFKVYYLWRPYLKDPKDDMVLESAVTSNAEAIVTFNKIDFKGIETFGIKAITPREFLVQIGELK